ncbi:hypothetical protein M413DRAFT_33126 [Hebeloma cylindrosporum]|uniref:Uncharacterized protein n=1 Tax=Hebeloma cylindrosporum TaxID=76867 RepID=A0A0C3BRI5_HEBCY|nr:hypothetical protein M413DRAFT_33126 [Hebeloma cylindrosporum h7]
MDPEQPPSNIDTDVASDVFPPPISLAHMSPSGDDNPQDVASDVFPPPTPLAHTSPSGDDISEAHSAMDGAPAEGAQKPPLRRRGRPAGAKNKKKAKGDAALRAKRKPTKRPLESSSSSSHSDQFDIKTPIVVRVQPNDRANKAPPPKKTRRTRSATVSNTTAGEHQKHVERQSQRSLILRNLSADLQSFLNYLKNPSGNMADDEPYERWLARVNDALENTDVNNSALILTNNKPTILMVSQQIKIRNKRDSLTAGFIGVLRILGRRSHGEP